MNSSTHLRTARSTLAITGIILSVVVFNSAAQAAKGKGGGGGKPDRTDVDYGCVLLNDGQINDIGPDTLIKSDGLGEYCHDGKRIRAWIRESFGFRVPKQSQRFVRMDLRQMDFGGNDPKLISGLFDFSEPLDLDWTSCSIRGSESDDGTVWRNMDIGESIEMFGMWVFGQTGSEEWYLRYGNVSPNSASGNTNTDPLEITRIHEDAWLITSIGTCALEGGSGRAQVAVGFVPFQMCFIRME